MRVTFFLPNLRPGGAERVMLQILHYFYRSEVIVDLLLFRKEGELLEQLHKEIVVHELGCSGTKEAVFPLITFCRKNKPDVLLTTLGASVAASIAKPFLPKRMKLISRLGSTYGAEIQTIKNPLQKIVYSGLTKQVAKRTDIFVFQSQFMESDFIKFINTEKPKRRIIYNPVSTSEILIKAKEDAISADLIAIGSLMPPKDYPTLIQSIFLYKRISITPISVKILGAGPLENELKTLVNDLDLNNEVQFLGYQSNPYKFLSKAKYLVSSSIYEGFSNVILESLALGIPVIATDCPSGNREVVEEGKNGFFTKVGDPEQMSRVIHKALVERINFDSKSIADTIKNKFDIAQVGEQYLSLIKR